MNKAVKISDLNSGQKDFLNSFYDESINEGSHSLCDELDEITERYELISELASGGMKEILVCEDKSTGRSVAKAILKDKKNPSAIEDFLREARVTASLQHPNIVPIHDIGKDKNGLPFFTMKLIEGQNLAEYFTEKERDLNELLDIFIKVCDAIAYAHAHGVIHLDLKPENIQVSQYGEVLVCDWGLARILGSKIQNEKLENYMLNEEYRDNKTLDGFIKGSPGYMAPEQINNKLGNKDEKTDIYALGGLLYYILTGKATVEESDIESKLTRILDGEFPAPTSLKPVPYSLEVVCLKALALKKEERYQTVLEMIKDIRSYLNGFAPTSENPGFVKQSALFYKRNKRACLTALVFLILLFSSGFFYTIELQKANKEKSVLYDSLQDKIISVANNSYENDSDYGKVISLLSNIHSHEAKVLKAKTYMILHKFDVANELLKDIPEKSLYDQNKLLMDNLVDGKLSSKALGQIVKDGRLNKVFRVKFFNYYLSKFANQDDQLYLVPILVATDHGLTKLNYSFKKEDDGVIVDFSNNPTLWKYMWFRHLGNVKDLNLSNTNLTILKAYGNLPLRKFNISGVPATNLSGIDRMTKLEELDLSGTLIHTIYQLKKLNSLKTVILPRNFPKEALSDLPKNVRPIFK